jgi:hypothetical protein
MKIKKVFWYAVTGIILLFDYAALDDITTGSEHDYRAEYFTIVLSIFLIFLILKFGLRKT